MLSAPTVDVGVVPNASVERTSVGSSRQLLVEPLPLSCAGSVSGVVRLCLMWNVICIPCVLDVVRWLTSRLFLLPWGATDTGTMHSHRLLALRRNGVRLLVLCLPTASGSIVLRPLGQHWLVLRLLGCLCLLSPPPSFSVYAACGSGWPPVPPVVSTASRALPTFVLCPLRRLEFVTFGVCSPRSGVSGRPSVCSTPPFSVGVGTVTTVVTTGSDMNFSPAVGFGVECS